MEIFRKKKKKTGYFGLVCPPKTPFFLFSLGLSPQKKEKG
jgi:hypothetical protein